LLLLLLLLRRLLGLLRLTRDSHHESYRPNDRFTFIIPRPLAQGK
jgi:hypothetical protein